MNDHEDHGQLLHQVARLGAARADIRTARASLIDRARAQLDSMPAAIQAAEAAVQSDSAGILGQRRLRTLLVERTRLEKVIGDYEQRQRASDDDKLPQDKP